MNAPFAWPGGKRLLKKLLLALIPPHRAYVEVFAGSAKLLFGKPAERFEVLNDFNGDLINFFRVAKHRAAELAELFERECIHAGRFSELRAARPDDELARALRFAYLAWWSFGGKGEHFAGHTIHGAGRERAVKKPLDLVRALLRETSRRLGGVLIEQRDFAECIRRYDSPGTFFYCDPPYLEFGKIGRYQTLPRERHEELVRLLAGVRGKFLLSYDDAPQVWRWARQHGLQVWRVRLFYTLARSGSKVASELLVANYPLPRSVRRLVARARGR